MFKDTRIITEVIDYNRDGVNTLIGLDENEWEIRAFNAFKTDNTYYETPPGAYVFKAQGFSSLSVEPYSILIEPHTEGLNKIDITDKVKHFLSKDEQLRSLGFPLIKQGWLLHGSAGCGKSHSVNTCVDQLLGNSGIALYIQTDKIDLAGVASWMQDHSPTKDVTKLFIVLEDLGGGESPDMNKRRVSESSSTMLAFLDGSSIPENWRHIPIVVFSTTNYPDLFLGNLTDRPGRFDEVISVPYPSGEGLIKYAENVLKGTLNDFDKNEIGKGEISVAHVRYALMKNIIYSDPIHNTIKAMREYSQKIKKTWEKEEAE